MKKIFTNNESKIYMLCAILAGIILVASGVAIAFFPKMAMSIALIVASILFFAFGITDSISALRNKQAEIDWKTTLGNGILTLLVGIFIFATIYVPTITPLKLIVVLSIWAIIRCILLVIGFIRGKFKKKENLLQALIMGCVGVCAFLFRDLIIASTKIIGYVLIVIGALILVYGFLKKALIKKEEPTSENSENKKENLSNNETKALDEPNNAESVKDEEPSTEQSTGESKTNE